MGRTYGFLPLHLDSIGHAAGTVCASAHPLMFRMQAQPIVSGAMLIEAFRSVRLLHTLKYPGVFKCVPRTLRDSHDARGSVGFRAASNNSISMVAAAATVANAHLEKETLAALAHEIPAPGQPEVFG